MLIRRLVTVAVALVLCCQNSTVLPSVVRPLRISVAGNKATNSSSHAKNLRTGDLTGLLEGSQVSGDAKNERDHKSEVAEESFVLEEQTDNVSPALLVPTRTLAVHRIGYGVTDNLQDTIQPEDSVKKQKERFPPSSSSSDISEAQLTIGTHSSDILDDFIGDLPTTQSLEPDLMELQAAKKFLPLILMGDPEPSDQSPECSYDKKHSVVIDTFVDAYGEDGCSSCELDDEGQPIGNFDEEASPQVWLQNRK